jgi:hypothetical protein
LADIPEKDICEIVLKTEQAIKSKEFKEAKLVLQDYLGGV